MDRYRGDVLAAGPPQRRALPRVEAEPDLVVEDAETGVCGAVVRCEKTAGGWTVTLEDRHGRHRVFPLGPGFLVDGAPVDLVRPAGGPAAAPPRRTASGSVPVLGARARVARGGRIYVEGRHDAELVEKVWGDDLRVEGVVVEHLGGIDDLPAVVRDFAAGPERRLGVLVDHLVPGSKESRLAAQVGVAARAGPRPPVRRRLAGGPAGRAGHRGLAGGPPRHAVEGGRLRRAGLAGRPACRLAPHPARRHVVRRPGAEPARPGRGAHRLRDRTVPHPLAWPRPHDGRRPTTGDCMTTTPPEPPADGDDRQPPPPPPCRRLRRAAPAPARGGYGQQPPPPGGYGDPGAPPPGAPGTGQLSQSDERLWAMLSQIGAVVIGFIAPLIVLLVQGDKSPFVRAHAVESLNFQITLLIVGIPLTIITCGIGAIIFVVGWVFEIIAGIKANNGEEYRYPVNIRMVK